MEVRKGGQNANRGGRIRGRRATAKKEEQRKVARVTAGHAGHVAKQDTFQRPVHKVEARTCMPLGGGK